MQESGVELSVTDVSVRRRLSFLDYMAGGCEIQCMLAVDFSSNNAPIDNPSSFHYAGEQSCSKRKVKHSIGFFSFAPPASVVHSCGAVSDTVSGGLECSNC